MKVIHEKRNEGKTTQMVEMLKTIPDALLLVCNHAEAQRIVRDFGLVEIAKRIITWDRYFARPELWDAALLIDNVDLFLQERFKFSILGVSINADS